MTTDRELLELAAKAVGYNTGHHWNAERLKLIPPVDSLVVILPDGQYHTAWNPLADDGDALRLAVKLDINLYNPGSHPAALHRTEEASTFYESGCARRSIVLAAAAIGRTLP